MRHGLWLMLASVSIVCMPAMARAATDTTAPSIVHAPIQYPASAVATREEGVVLVAAEVDASGRVADASIDASSGHADLDAAALRSISLWTFHPAMKEGMPVAERVRLPIDFRLSYPGPPPGPRLSPSAIAGGVLSSLGSLIWIVGFGWSVVLAKRKSILWLSFMVAAWGITYPLFVAVHWSAAKHNLALVASGVVLFCLGLYLTHLQ